MAARVRRTPATAPDVSLGTPAEVSAHLRVPVLTLYQWRHRGIGPRSCRVGRHIRYRWQDVEAWLDEQASQPQGA
jgi:excisionase family DNA binding protein